MTYMVKLAERSGCQPICAPNHNNLYERYVMATRNPITPRNDLSADYVRSILDYDPETGVFRWKYRPIASFKTLRAANAWNTKYANKVAGGNNGGGYIEIRACGHRFFAHRLAWVYMIGKWPKYGIDHINMNKKDNRFCNLREATQSQNGQNCRLRRQNTSGVKGVYFQKGVNMWRARINVEGTTVQLGYFHNIKDARRARVAAEERYFGEYRRAT